jgi:hypothetical protein
VIQIQIRVGLGMVLACGVPFAGLSAQGAGSGAQAPPMTPTERAAAQAKLQAQAATIFNGPISASKQELRDDLVPLRDTLQETDGTAARLMRAHAGGSRSVTMSSARQLHVDCAGGSVVAGTTIAKMVGMRTNSADGDKTLDNYRAAVATVQHALSECSRTIGDALAGKSPDQAALAAIAATVDRAIEHHDATLMAFTSRLGITMLPKGTTQAPSH